MSWHPLRGWVEALRDWGFLIPTVGLVLLGALLWSPAQEVRDDATSVVGRAVGVEEGRCPSGWSYNPGTNGDIREERCQQGSWFAILWPGLPDANYGWDTAAGGNAPNFVACADIPNWPSTRCEAPEGQ